MNETVKIISKADPSIDAATTIVATYLERSSVALGDLPSLVLSVRCALLVPMSGFAFGAPAADRAESTTSEQVEQRADPAPQAATLKPAVPIDQSITPDAIISLENGQRYQTMSRHLKGLGMTPAEYRAKWGLPADYPMVAPNYSAKRAEIAKAQGLGVTTRADPIKDLFADTSSGAVEVAPPATSRSRRSERQPEAATA